MSVETRRKEREPKTETEKALMAQKTKEGLQGLAIGPVTGLLGLPSDIIDLADIANDAIAKYGADTTIAQFSKLIKPQLDAVQEKYGRDAFDKGFTKLTGIKSDPTKPAQFLGELVSLGSVAKTGAKGVKLVGETISDTYKGAKKLFEDSTLPPPDNLAAQTAGATKPVGQLEQTKKLLDKEKTISTNIPTSIPADEIINAPTINPTMAGMNTDTGKLQARRFMDLEGKGNITPEKLFEETGVYRGQDGKLRYEIDDRNADFVKGFKPKSGEDYALYKVLKFDDLYKEYGKDLTVGGRRYGSLRNIRVNFIRDTDTSYLGKYEPDVDAITINLSKESNKDSEKMISTLLHEVQHAVQRREGFITGTSPERQLIESPNYDDYLKAKSYVENRTIRDKKTGAYITPAEASKKQIVEDELIDDIPPNTFISNDRRNQHVNQLNNDIRVYNAFLKTKNLRTRSNLQEVIAKQMLSKNISVKEAAQLNPAILAKETYDFLIKDIKNITGKSFDEAEKYISRYRDVVEKERKATELMQSEEAIAREKYYSKYGEREAKLVQQRYERRLNLKKFGLDDDVVKKDMRLETDFLKGEDTTLGQMGGFGSKEKKRLDKLKRTDPVTGKVKPKVAIDIPDVSKSVDILEKTPVKKSPALQKISEITKLRDGTLGSRTPMDKDGLPKDLIRDKDGKPLVLYYGDMGQVYDPVTQTYKDSDIPGKLTNKFAPSGRTYTIDKKVGNFVTPNPVFASGYASQEGGSVIPVYLIADKVSNIKARSFSDIDKAGGDAKRGEVFIGDVGYDSAAPVKLVDGRKVKDVKARDESIKKYGTEQYTFNRGTQVFSAITGERLTNLPTIDQNIRNKLLKLTQKEEDVLLKKMSPEERIKYKAKKTYTEDLIDDTDFVEDMFKLDRKGDITRNEKKRNLAKGGDMKKQMDLFQEGGLKDEGGTVDPVSGNDVPPGSTQEEVRDDIPAQLSEGEFVFPADVVRFIGLEKLMRLRQEAKAGLKRMEEMGQMGNSEEATLPDDMPFTIDDLDMEDEEEYNTDTQEMNQGGMVRVGGVDMQKPRIAGQQFADGGVVQAQSGTFVAPGSGVTTIPSQFAGQNLPSYKPNETIQSGTRPAYTVPIIPSNVSNFRQLPIAQTGQQQIAKTPSFEDLLGKNPGQYDELREYVNDAGMKLRIPFKNGQPIYPIPEGYKFVDPEEEQTETTTVQSVKPKTVQTTGEGSDDSGVKVGTTKIGKTGKGITDKSLTENQKAGVVMSALDKATDKGKLGKALGVLGTSMIPGIGLTGALAGQQLGFDPLAPNRTELDDILGQFGYKGIGMPSDPMAAIGLTQEQATNMANSVSQAELSSNAMQEAIAQSIYGVSKAEALAMYGLSPNTTLGIKGYKPGNIDPTTNATYSINGQATDDDNNVSYSSFGAFSNAMSASSKSGYFGGEKQAQKDAAKGNQKAKDFLNNLEIETLSDKESFTGSKDDTFGYTESQGTSTGDTADDTSISDVGSEEDPGPSSNDSDSDTGGTEAGTSDDGGMSSEEGVGMGDAFKKGGLAKRKPKPKKMKRGGLASR